MEYNSIIQRGKNKDLKVLNLNTDGWAKWEANPEEREWIKLYASKQGYDKILFKERVLWNRTKK